MGGADEATDIAGLVVAHHAAVYRYAYRLTGSTVDAEDLTQQAFLIAQENLAQLADARNARQWLLSILRRLFWAQQKRGSRFKPQPPKALEDLADPQSARCESSWDPERLQQALDELPPGHRLVIVMFYFEELSYREIAAELDLPLGTVMSRLSRAKAHLRAKLLGEKKVTVFAPRGIR